VPTYQYACTECGEQLEVVQRFTDDALTECPACSGRLRKVFSPVGVVFKGSGFYRTDSRKTAAAAAKSTDKSGEKSTAGSSDSTSQPSAAGSSSSSSGSGSGSSGSTSSGSGGGKGSSPSTSAA
jgi:putative FmdB family regulatory protein